MVISAKNPVHSVFFLILGFFSAAGLFVLLGAEYIAMTLVIVYVGAVAVLFLFVVMMLDINITQMRQGFLRYLPLGLLVACVLFVEMMLMFYASFHQESFRPLPLHPAPLAAQVANTQALGMLLYTAYAPAFQIAGLILLVAMMGAIVLTLRHGKDVRRQDIRRQQRRTRGQGVTLVKVRPGQGA
jgi:NADH-quinone oxidoreductase subunit J